MADDQLISNSNDKNLQPSRAGSYLIQDKNGDNVRKQLTGIATKAQIGGDSGYDIGTSTYPEDLYSNRKEYGGNYVIFYINVAEDSKILKENPQAAFNGKVPSRLRGDLVGQNLNKAQASAAGTVAAATAVTGAQALGNAVTKGTDGLKDLADTALKSGVGGLAASGTVALAANSMSRQQKRLKQAIALHVPNQLSINYTMDWQTEDTFAFQAAAMASTEVTKAVATGGAKSNMMGTVGSIATNIALQTPGLSGALSASSGMAANPKKEQVFKNVNFREFTFDYQFSPRSAAEAAHVREIIKQFKLHMHPEYKDTNNFVFIFPSEFDIFYYNNGQENMYLNRHTSCVLKNMTVNYTPQGAFNTFADGMPTQINMQLQFVELAILTKETILDGF